MQNFSSSFSVWLSEIRSLKKNEKSHLRSILLKLWTGMSTVLEEKQQEFIKEEFYNHRKKCFDGSKEKKKIVIY